MDDALRIIAIWTHILGIALFVGPQFFLAMAWVPTARNIPDMGIRIEATRSLTRRFGHIGGAGLVLLLVSGTYLISTWRDYYGYPDEESFMAVRYGVLFSVKMLLLLVMIAVVGLHMFRTGPKLIETMEAHRDGRANDAELHKARVASSVISGIGLLLALTIMVFGAMMNTGSFSLD